MDGSSATDIVKGWIKNPGYAPQFFKDFIVNVRTQCAYEIFHFPENWDERFRNQVEAALKKSKSSNKK